MKSDGRSNDEPSPRSAPDAHTSLDNAPVEQLWQPTASQLAYVRDERPRHSHEIMEWPGVPNLAAVQTALDEIFRRHDVLRTRYVSDRAGKTWAITEERVPTAMQIIDLSGLEPSQIEPAARREAERFVRRPFSLANAPLLRFAIMRIGPSDFLLLFCSHHSIMDAWSGVVLKQDLQALLKSIHGGEPNALPWLPLQFPQYAREQREWLSNGVAQSHLEYWKRVLAGAKSAFWLPHDAPETRTDLHVSPPPTRHRVSAEVGRALSAFSIRNGSTLFATVVTAFGAVLSRWSGLYDVFIWVPHWGRPQGRLHNLIGAFFDVWPLRLDFSGDPTFFEAFGRVRQSCLDALPHTQVSGVLLRAEIDRITGGRVFPTTVFNFSPKTPESVRSGHRTHTDWVPRTGRLDGSRFALGIGVFANDGGITWDIGHGDTLFRASTIDSVSRAYASVLERVATDPDCRLSTMPLPVELTTRVDADAAMMAQRTPERRGAE